LSTPIGAITEISPKGFTLGVKKAIFKKFTHFMTLTWAQGRKKEEG